MDQSSLLLLLLFVLLMSTGTHRAAVLTAAAAAAATTATGAGPASVSEAAQCAHPLVTQQPQNHKAPQLAQANQPC
jgi:hypothetical protein